MASFAALCALDLARQQWEVGMKPDTVAASLHPLYAFFEFSYSC